MAGFAHAPASVYSVKRERRFPADPYVRYARTFSMHRFAASTLGTRATL